MAKNPGKNNPQSGSIIQGLVMSMEPCGGFRFLIIVREKGQMNLFTGKVLCKGSSRHVE